MIQWKLKQNDIYEGYVGNMKVFEIFEAPHQHPEIKGPGEWILMSPAISFLEPCRFTTPSGAQVYAISVIDRIIKSFEWEELVKDFSHASPNHYSPTQKKCPMCHKKMKYHHGIFYTPDGFPDSERSRDPYYVCVCGHELLDVEYSRDFPVNSKGEVFTWPGE